ncbi:30S ribosomal protein S3 [candidate division WOR-3 bacterium]|nr:30S ribosomal protein S3 [candidate division WOR-3 bacterium]
MGQKTHPLGFRLGITEDWSSKWFTKNKFAEFITEDYLIRKYIQERLKGAAISKVNIERTPKNVAATIHTARPGIVIGRKGSFIDRLRNELKMAISHDITINVQELKDPELDAQLVASAIARQIERRIACRRAMKRAVKSAMKLGAKGIKVVCKGRLGGSEIARQEWYKEGKIPLHTIKIPIDYACVPARTISGIVGVKVWIYKERG